MTVVFITLFVQSVFALCCCNDADFPTVGLIKDYLILVPARTNGVGLQEA